MLFLYHFVCLIFLRKNPPKNILMAKYLYANIVNFLVKIARQLFAFHVLPMIKIHVLDVEKEISIQNKKRVLKN